MDIHLLGKKGEQLAVRYLKKKGYKILEKDLRLRSGEVDIVAMDGVYLVFIEVKTRMTKNENFMPRLSVDIERKKRYRAIAHEYVKRISASQVGIRFDILEVIWQGEDGKPQISHLVAAF